MGDFLNLEGRIAVVTGGARGIGLAITRALIDHGVRVHVFDVAPGKGDDAAPYSFHQADTVSYTHLTLPTNREV